MTSASSVPAHAENDAVVAHQLRLLCWGLALAGPGFLLGLAAVQPKYTAPAAALGGGFVALCGLAAACQRRRRDRLGATLLVGGLLLLVGVLTWWGGGIRSPAVGTFLPAVVLAATLLGWRRGMVTAAVAMAWVLALVPAENHGLLPPAASPGPVALAVSRALDLGLLVFLFWSASAGAQLRRAGPTGARTPQQRTEEALTARERRLALALEASRDAVFDLDLVTGEAYCSPRYFEMLGYAADELPSSLATWRQLLHPDDRPAAEAAIARFAESGTDTHQIEFRLRTKAGGWRWIFSHGRIVARDAAGRPLRLIGTHIDITDRKLAEQALLRERDLVARLLETSPSGIVGTDADGEIIFANHEAERLLRLRRAEPGGHRYAPPAWEVHTADGAPVPVDQRPIQRVLTSRRPLPDVHQLLTWADGHQVLLAINLSPLLRADHHLEGVVATFEDITARERAAAALRHSEEQYRLLFDAGNDAIFVNEVEPSGQPTALTQVNTIACELLGYTREELLARRPYDLTPPTHAARAALAVERLRREGHVLFETEMLACDGRHIPVEINARRSTLAGRPTVLSIVRDVSERRRLEAQLRQAQKMEVFGQLAGGVAHDFNNLLVAIIGNTELLLEHPEMVGRLREQLEQILGAGRRAAALTRQLLLFARKQVAKPELCDLGAIAANHAKLLRRIIGEDIELLLELDPAPLPVNADVNMIEQVAMNLAVNARDAMPRGGTLTLRTARRTLDAAAAARASCPPGDYATLIVADTGTGIPEPIRARIFEPFFTTKPSGQGTGLGLSTVLGIVQQHRGGIDLVSEPDCGTVFSVFLPLATSALPGPAVTAPPARPATAAMILVVEDEDAVRAIIERTLAKAGYHVLLTKSAAEGIAQLERGAAQIDLVLSDVVMPGGIDGVELHAYIAQRWPTLPVLLMSGYAKNLDETKLRLLPKPFTTLQLLAYVQEGLAQRSTLRPK